jgi:hypothetical protein
LLAAAQPCPPCTRRGGCRRRPALLWRLFTPSGRGFATSATDRLRPRR